MKQRILIIGLVWPEPTSSAAGWRMLQIIDLFKEKGYEVHFASAASKSEFSFPLYEKGVIEQEILLNDSSFDKYLQELEPHIVLFDRFMIEEQYSWRVAQSCPQAIRILDTEDLHFLRKTRFDAYKKNKDVEEDQYYDVNSIREIASIFRSDLSIIISTKELEILKDKFSVPEKILNYLPLSFRKDLIHSNPIPNYTQRKDFVFIGNFLHEPNWKTVQYLKAIWPKIRKQLPGIELHIYGAYPSQKVYELNQEKEGFIIKGRAEDAISCLSNYRVLLAPIPFGAGQKGKFIDALHAGTVSVTTTVGAEGMSLDSKWNGFITDLEEEIVEKAILLYTDENIWGFAHQQGIEILNQLKQQNWEALFIEQIEDINLNLEKHRKSNFFGEILWFNQFQSNKYLSKWIEEKNKNN